MQFIFPPEIATLFDDFCGALAHATGVDKETLRCCDTLEDFIYRVYREGWKDGKDDTFKHQDRSLATLFTE